MGELVESPTTPKSAAGVKIPAAKEDEGRIDSEVPYSARANSQQGFDQKNEFSVVIFS